MPSISTLILLVAATTVSARSPWPANCLYTTPPPNYFAQTVVPYNWTLDSIVRTCADDGSVCSYSLSLDQDQGAGPTVISFDVAEGCEQPAYRIASNGTANGYDIALQWAPTDPNNYEGSGITRFIIAQNGDHIYPSFYDSTLGSGVSPAPAEYTVYSD